VTGIDYDNDGVDDLVYGIYDEMRTVLSGATGEKLFEYLNIVRKFIKDNRKHFRRDNE